MRNTFFGLGLIRAKVLIQLWKLNSYHSIVRWTKNSPQIDPVVSFVLENFSNSFSQLQQDLVALWVKERIFGKESQGYFVELGATNGIHLSNTFMLEKFHGWSGILCEPSVNYYPELIKNRNVSTENRCVFSTTGEMLEFIDRDIGEHSSLSGFYRNGGGLDKSEKERARYQVESITLGDLLSKHDAPNQIHFLSIDTEGSEYEILKNFDFKEREVVFICVELSFNSELIERVLLSNGYLRILPEYSRWDGWFMHNKYAEILRETESDHG
jgi:FkbM family methyltransferase